MSTVNVNAMTEHVAAEDPTGQAILDGKIPAELAGVTEPAGGREDDIAARILDGEITNVDQIDVGETVNANYASEMLRNASKNTTTNEEEAEMARKILNGEYP
ncbi:hypothetical protein PTSG_01768 [Salpingoeca rosetta]|uniref:Uncharacterized protein n=1 Tax=Salpingoeca rosetta (strain ATCC 50818 / BSB-021) TaxID=946362 RepID=F2TYW8_SALR5|nr:uncharacterized protein PTSG_01768 [Salpingoeca rosetta]EGD78792.1 hypothetical protein PTSG_01768 [Salpingoeca rosetta]|eukprot:XP_004997748.1 hypothetical protein PTSG_01768 [Salpingoeca rosetta]